MYIPQDPPLVLHMPTSWWPAVQPVTSPHLNGQTPGQKRQMCYHSASDPALMLGGVAPEVNVRECIARACFHCVSARLSNSENSENVV